MTPELTSMTKGVVLGLAAGDGRGLNKALKHSLAGVTKPSMPSSR